MKRLILALAILSLVACVCLTPTALAQGSPNPGARWEFAVVKWDGPDRIYYNLPDKFEMVHLKDLGVEIPKEAQQEEFCLAWAANKMAADGWEAVNLNSRRILMRRPKAN